MIPIEKPSMYVNYIIYMQIKLFLHGNFNLLFCIIKLYLNVAVCIYY